MLIRGFLFLCAWAVLPVSAIESLYSVVGTVTIDVH